MMSVNPVDLVALLIVVQYVLILTNVGRCRARTGIQAPAVTGHPLFERAYRVQMNTLELLVVMLPLLYIAARYWPPLWVAAAGAVYLVGRGIFWYAYMTDPARRGLGFVLSVTPVFLLSLATLVRVVMGSAPRGS